jgi:hypothetical protein
MFVWQWNSFAASSNLESFILSNNLAVIILISLDALLSANTARSKKIKTTPIEINISFIIFFIAIFPLKVWLLLAPSTVINMPPNMECRKQPKISRLLRKDFWRE